LKQRPRLSSFYNQKIFLFFRNIPNKKLHICTYFHIRSTQTTTHKIMKKLFTSLLCMLLFGQGIAQNSLEKVLAYLKQQKGIVFQPSDWKVTDEIAYPQTGISYVYLRQVHQGVEIYNSSVSVMIKNGEVRSFTGKIHQNYRMASSARFSLQASDAIKKSVQELSPQATALQIRVLPQFQQNKAGFEIYDKGTFSYENIPTKKVYFLNDKNELNAGWNLSLAPIGSVDWWDVLIDAGSGKMIQKINWTTKCNFDHSTLKTPSKHNHNQVCLENVQTNQRSDGASYRVFDLPVESPVHGNRTLVTNPADALASPFGWHDTNGAAGAEFTTTQGNNVHAYDDRANTNSPGFSPDGGASLIFDFPYTTTTAPTDYLSFAVTNTFFMSNVIHDVFYHMGFDEPSGNFQVNNYGRGGAGNDAVRAEAQDGSGRNNANFGTPPDGSQPRMQMYIWDARTVNEYLTITSPASIADTYVTGTAQFGAAISSTAISGQLVLVNDGSANPTFGCVTIPAGSLNGKIAVIDRGECAFTVKVKNAQNAGAIGVIIVNNVSGGVIALGGTDATVTIPSVMVSLEDGTLLKNTMQSQTVMGSLVTTPSATVVDTDSDLDNGIIIHEYAHGISTRLTGGPANSNCLNNNEQMGEGWGDYFGLVLTMKSTDVAAQSRGIGTYVTGQPTTGGGIRPAPYTTNRAVNNYTYADLPNTSLSQPHGIGFVWATMLWDMTWKFVDRYGFDPNLKTGNGGNRKALKLVVEGLKLQPCSPGFEDGRDAILRANQELYGGADLDIIWEAFADRGLGYYASQGSSNNRNDGVADFTRPPLCPADAGEMTRPNNTGSGDIKINLGADVGAFKRTYNNTSQKDPADPNNTYTFGLNYTYAFLLTRNDTIIHHNLTGDFDFTTLPKGKYIIWGMSFKTVPASLTTYMTGKVKVNQIQADITSGAVCADLSKTYASGSEVSVEILATDNGTTEPTSIAEPLSAKTQIFPNPANSEFNLNIAGEAGKTFHMTIFNAQGKLLETYTIQANSAHFSKKFDVNKWAKGVYIIKLEGDGRIFADKLIVE